MRSVRGYLKLHEHMDVFIFSQIETSGHMSVLRLSNLSSMDHNTRISCTAENIVGEKEASVLLDILCMFACWDVCLDYCVRDFSVCPSLFSLCSIFLFYQFLPKSPNCATPSQIITGASPSVWQVRETSSQSPSVMLPSLSCVRHSKLQD